MPGASPALITEEKPQRLLHGSVLFIVLTALLYILFLEALDNTVIGPALPHIAEDFHGLDRYSWTVTIYLLTSTIVIPVAGKLSDQFGRKGFLLAGAGLFLFGSLLTGAAQTMNQLILFRGLQGIGAGMGMTLVATIIGDLFPPEERAKWLSTINIVYAVSNLAGPSLGGWFTDHGPLLGSLVTASTRWRWIFYLNLPLGLIAIIIVIIFLPAVTAERSHPTKGWEAVRRIDVTGALLCAVATTCLLLGLTWGSNETFAWGSPQVIGILAVAVISIPLLVLAERRAFEPMLPLNFFRNQVFIADAALSLLIYIILLGLAVYFPLFLQSVLALSATNTGVTLTPFSLSIPLSAALGGALISWRKRHQFIAVIGTTVTAIGVFFLARMTTTTGLLEAVVFMIIAGFGIGFMFSVLYVAAQNVLPPTQLGVGTAVVRYLGQIGATMGTAIIGAIVNQSLPGNLLNLPEPALRQAFAAALQRGFIAVLLFCVIAILAACFLKDAPGIETTNRQPAASQPGSAPRLLQWLPRKKR